MSKLQELYNIKRDTHSDINEHLHILYAFAKKCEKVAEFGVRDVVSSYALALAKPTKLICVDIVKSDAVEPFLEICKSEGVDVQFYQTDTREFELENIDMLFIDTLHTFGQLTAELEKHHSKVKKFIVLHDTITFGNADESKTDTEKKGLIPAIKNFLASHPYWHELVTFENCNGLTILQKK
jgi:hypothetical protein